MIESAKHNKYPSEENYRKSA